MSGHAFRELVDAVSDSGRWSDEQGALNHLTRDRIAAAWARSHAETTISSRFRPRRADVPVPADHHMTMLPEDDGVAKDYIDVDYHNDGPIDAFCHVSFNGFRPPVSAAHALR